MRNLLAVLTVLCAALLPVGSPAAEQRYAVIDELPLAGGGRLENCRIGYRVYGELAADRGNVLLFPTWFTGTVAHLEAFGRIGPGKLADTDRWYVIAVDALGNGESCSPSNHGGEYPRIAIADMVDSQHRLLTEHLGIDRVHAVIGISMGGMQVFEWLGRYPGFMDRAVALDGTPRQTSYDVLLWQTQKDVIRRLQKAQTPDAEIGQVVARMQALNLYTPEYFVENVPVDELDEAVDPGGQAGNGFRPDDQVAQLEAMLSHDVLSPDPAGWQQRVRAPFLVVAGERDYMVNPLPAKRLAERLGMPYLAVDSLCGHISTSCENAVVVPRVAAFLAAEAPAAH